jgi:Mrp family chromosome partitioning ATPase
VRRRARFWLPVGVGVAAGIAAGVVALALTAPVYAASTSVLVQPVGGDAVNMRTEAELVRSTQTAIDAYARITGNPANPPTVGRLAGVEPVPDTSVLKITFEARTAEAARAGATAFAEAYLAGRAGAARAAVDAEVSAVQRQLDDIHTQLGEINALIASSPSGSPDLDSLRATQTSLGAQSASLNARLGELQTTTVDPGRVVAQAELPSAPVRPNRVRYLGVAAALGALGGAALDLARRRWSGRVRHGGELRRHRVPLLAELAAPAVATPGGPQDPGTRAFGRLRNEVDATLTATDRILLVTGASPGPASTVVAASLAAAFARGDNDVVLVGASVPELGAGRGAWDGATHALTLAGIFDLADIPGLTDVLAGRTSLHRATQRAARTPRLSVVTPGGTASAGGLLQSEGARSVLRQLATRTRYVIVDAPSTASGADAQSLASSADVALLVVEAGHTRHADVADAATQLARVGTRLLGAVVVPGRPPTRPSTSDDEGPAERVPVAIAAYETEGWISGRADSLDGPTTKLDLVNRRPRARSRAPHEPEPGLAESAGPTG